MEREGGADAAWERQRVERAGTRKEGEGREVEGSEEHEMGAMQPCRDPLGEGAWVEGQEVDAGRRERWKGLQRGCNV